MMLSEGPHGPKGEITWAPGQGNTIAVLLVIGIPLVAAGIFFLSRASNSD